MLTVPDQVIFLKESAISLSYLQQIQDKLSKHSKSTSKKLVVFDIDDTIIDCRHRKRRVFQDFARVIDHQREFPKHCQALTTIALHQIQFRVSECLAGLKIKDLEFESSLTKFWRQHYFTNAYLLHDQAFDGAVRFVKDCLQLGVDVVYLTGRNEPSMGDGTKRRLNELGFPWPHERAHLILKPDPNQADLDFKQLAMAQIDQIGHTIASFENELRNLNMMADYFTDALLFHRQTLQSPDQPPPHPRIIPHFNFNNEYRSQDLGQS